MLWANRNGFFYVLDRVTGKFLQGTPFVKINWASGLDANGRPIADAAARGVTDVAGQSGRDQLVLAVVQPAHRALLRVGVARLRVVVPAPASGVHARPHVLRRHAPHGGADAGLAGDWHRPAHAHQQLDRRGRQRRRDRASTRAPGSAKWTFTQYDVTDSGILTTATDLLFTGGREGYFHALDARTGARAVEDEPRRPDRQRADQLSGGREAVRRDHLRQQPRGVRVASRA